MRLPWDRPQLLQSALFQHYGQVAAARPPVQNSSGNCLTLRCSGAHRNEFGSINDEPGPGHDQHTCLKPCRVSSVPRTPRRFVWERRHALAHHLHQQRLPLPRPQRRGFSKLFLLNTNFRQEPLSKNFKHGWQLIEVLALPRASPRFALRRVVE